ncbi:MAG: hypothetical protein RL414_1284 [Actinomycetota bacterium]|jgi:thiol-disulfide isomerase/thioredoxin
MKMQRGFIPLLAILSLVVGVAAPTTGSAQIKNSSASLTNKALLNFTGKTVDGKNFNSKSLINKKPTVIWFWAPWCAICRNESEFIVASAEKYKGKVNFLGIGSLGSSDEMKEFVDHTGTSIFTNLNDGTSKLWNRFGVVIQPTLIFVDAKGKISSKIGPSDEVFLEKKITSLLSVK